MTNTRLILVGFTTHRGTDLYLNIDTIEALFTSPVTNGTTIQTTSGNTYGSTMPLDAALARYRQAVEDTDT